MLFVLTLTCALMAQSPGQPSRAMAVTIDDLPTVWTLGDDLARAEATTRDLLAAIRRTGVPAIGFVNEGKLQPSGVVQPQRVALLERWLDAGLDLGNHTFSHLDLHATDVETFTREIAAGEAVTRKLLDARGRRLRYFRHPFLHTGLSREVRDQVHAFLAARGYVVAPVTVDNSDYVFAAAYDRAMAASDTELARKIVAEHVDYLERAVAFYERQSVAIVGREIAQVLLLHANALNAVAFEKLVERLRARGYEFVPLEDALRDSAYRLPDEYFGPAGMTWLHRWALTQGKRGAVFDGEPRVPDWIQRAAQSGK